MKNIATPDDGLKNLIGIYRRAFQIPENLNHYSEQDFKIAERMFIKHMLQKGDLSDATRQSSAL
jgi:hypothetical protein